MSMTRGSIMQTSISNFRKLAAGPLLISLALATFSAQAGNGRIQISQTDALAGGITSSDTAGFPVTLDIAGSYVLTSDLVVVDINTHAIALTSGDVTIDLNGFSIIGPASCTGGNSNGGDLACSPSGSGNGIDANATFVTIRNGFIRGFGNHGINLASSCRVTDVNLTENVVDGIHYLDSCILRNNVAWKNGQDGFDAGQASLMVSNTSNRNGAYGMRGNTGSAYVGNSASDNGTDGIAGLVGGNLMRDNSAESNLQNGISAGAGAVVTGNIVRNNTGQQLFLNGTAGYGQNNINLSNNGTTTVTGGVNMGDNACDGNSTCP
jgi:hypothetical protein